MRRTAVKIKPASGFSRILHWGLVVILPVLVFALVRWNLVPLAFLVIILSKWRMFAVRPRHWPANIRANSIDIIVGVSFVVFMWQAPAQTSWQYVWAGAYAAWLLFIKPRSTTFWTTVQAGIGQLVGLTAMYMLWGNSALLVLVVGTGGICYLAARHFLSNFDEPLAYFLAQLWAFFGAALTWVLGHWLLYYGTVLAQPVMIISVFAYGFVALYYLESSDRLSTAVRREIVFAMTIVMLAIIIGGSIAGSWGDKAL